jgi:hypothetical protein
MTERQDSAPSNEQFLDAVGELAKPLGWQLQHFTRDQELVALVPTENDQSFEQFIWVYDTDGVFLRCLLVSRAVVPPERQPAILELCARINDGLNFGCAEYGFDDQVIAFRNSVDLKTCAPLQKVVNDATSRVLSLGRRYAVAIDATLAGDTPEDAVKKAEAT